MLFFYYKKIKTKKGSSFEILVSIKKDKLKNMLFWISISLNTRVNPNLKSKLKGNLLQLVLKWK